MYKVEWTKDQIYYRNNLIQGFIICIVGILLLSFLPLEDGSFTTFDLKTGFFAMGFFSPFIIAKLLADRMSEKDDPRLL